MFKYMYTDGTMNKCPDYQGALSYITLTQIGGLVIVRFHYVKW